MHSYSLRTSTRRRERRPSNPTEALVLNHAEALAVVLVNVPLLPPTLATLRLVSRAVRLAVDNAVTELELPLAPTAFHPTACRELVSGLSSLCLIIPENAYSGYRNFHSTYDVAKDNANTLQRLTLKAKNYEYDQHFLYPWHNAVQTLTGCKMPRLTELQLMCLPTTFQLLKIDCMPALTNLELYGRLKGDDLTALRRGKHFCGTIERLSLKTSVSVGEPDLAFYNALKALLEATQKLRYLSLNVIDCLCRDLGFLSGTALPSLRELHLSGIPNDCSLSPITSIPRTSLETLSLSGGRASEDEVLAVVSAEPEVLPSLQCLKLGLDCGKNSFLSSISMTKLTALHLEGCTMGLIDDVSHVAAALARLPLLEDLRVCPSRIDNEVFGFGDYESTSALLSGPPLPRLRRLELGKAWMDEDDSIDALCQHADKIPNIEKLIFGNSYINLTGVLQLVSAGRAGRWPQLRLLYIDVIHPEDPHGEVVEPERCIDLLRGAWPEAKIKIGGGTEWC